MEKAIKQVGIFAVIVCVPLTIYLALTGALGFNQPEQAQETGYVWLAGQRLVAERLETPDDAFWGWRTDQESVTELDNGHFQTVGWVRYTTNSEEVVVVKFESEIRQHCGKWELVNLQVPNQLPF